MKRSATVGTDGRERTAQRRGSLDGIQVAVGQVAARVGDVAANLALADSYAARAAARGADLLVLPETFVQGYSLASSSLALAEPLDGGSVTRLRSIAARRRIAIVAGIIERNPARSNRPFNTTVLVDCGGQLVGAYQKTHLYDREYEAFSAGDAYPVFDLELAGGRRIRVGMCICADIEYPEVARLLALDGAQLICVASADMDPFRPQQAANLMSRAIENNVYVALANTVDRRPNVTFFGGSGIAGPDGSLVSAGYLRPRLAVAGLSDAAVDASGGTGAYLRARRVSTFRGLLAPVKGGSRA